MSGAATPLLTMSLVGHSAGWRVVAATQVDGRVAVVPPASAIIGTAPEAA